MVFSLRGRKGNIMNKFIISGRLCADPEIRYTQNGTLVVTFDFAVNRRFKREGDPDADFFRCSAFGKTAEVFQKCSITKGTKLILEGEVRNNNYTDKEGVKHYSVQVVVSSIEFCESKAADQNSQEAAPAYAPNNTGYNAAVTAAHAFPPAPQYSQESIGSDGFEEYQSDEGLPF